MTTAERGGEEISPTQDAPAGLPAADVPGPLLAVYAHPDDETLQAGGLLALAAAQGRRVIVVTATRGERGEMINAPEIQGTPAVAPAREREIHEALTALGVREHLWLDALASDAHWTDSGMVWTRPGVAGPALDAPATALSRGDLATQAGALADLIRLVRPAVVLCDEPGGSYGHPDHVRTAAITAAAVERAADPARPRAWSTPVLASVVVDSGRLVVARDEIERASASVDARDRHGWPLLPPPEQPPALARSGEDVSLEIDVTAQLPRVLAALRCYPSQVQAVQVPELDAAGEEGVRRLAADQAAVGWYALSDGVAQPVYPVVALQVRRGTAEDLGFGPDARTAPPAPARPASTGALLGRGAMGFGLGVLAATIGTLVARVRWWEIPLGIVLAAVIVVVAGLLARSIGRGSGLLGFGLGVVALVQAFALLTHDWTDVLIPGDTLGSAWLLVSVLAVAVAAFAPRRWVGER